MTMFNLKPPSINGATTEAQIKQVTDYIYQTIGELNWALNTIQNEQKTNTDNAIEKINNKLNNVREE